jgi:hypothetical protein
MNGVGGIQRRGEQQCQPGMSDAPLYGERKTCTSRRCSADDGVLATSVPKGAWRVDSHTRKRVVPTISATALRDLQHDAAQRNGVCRRGGASSSVRAKRFSLDLNR